MIMPLYQQIAAATPYTVYLIDNGGLEIRVQDQQEGNISTKLDGPTLVQGFLATQLIAQAISTNQRKPHASITPATLDNYVRICKEWFDNCVLGKKSFGSVEQAEYGLYVPGGIESLVHRSSLNEINQVMKLAQIQKVLYDGKEILYMLGLVDGNGESRLILDGSRVGGARVSFDALRSVAEQTGWEEILNVIAHEYGTDPATRAKRTEYVAGLKLALAEFCSIAPDLGAIFATTEDSHSIASVRSIDLFLKNGRYVPEMGIKRLDEIFKRQSEKPSRFDTYFSLLQTNLRIGLIYYLLVNNTETDTISEHRPQSLRMLQYEIGMERGRMNSQPHRAGMPNNPKKEVESMPTPVAPTPEPAKIDPAQTFSERLPNARLDIDEALRAYLQEGSVQDHAKGSVEDPVTPAPSQREGWGILKKRRKS
ncbi:hypothetical protein HYV86_06825 [Candidatus Woesearchaeota archaeon]|nr:hypothetical protein [Candidatus Woesearchaeota archaeon]